MILVIQRVSSADVVIKEKEPISIEAGLLAFVGIEHSDVQEDADWLASKLLQMRIFPDQSGKMNLSVQEIKGEILIVSQFTLHADIKKGNRPSFIKAARPETAVPLYEHFVQQCSLSGLAVKTGVFGSNMRISLINEGPVTIIANSKDRGQSTV